MLRGYMKNYENDFGNEKAQRAVTNFIKIVEQARNGDLSGENLRHLDLSHTPMDGLYFSHSKRVAHFDGSILSSESLLQEGHVEHINCVTYSPDGKSIATTSYNNLRICSAETGEIQNKIESAYRFLSVDYSADGQYIVTAHDDGTAVVWDKDTLFVKSLIGHGGGVNTAKFSPCGNFLLTASEDKTARIWNLQTDEVVILEGHTRAIQSANYNPDGGRQIVTSSQDGSVRIWDSQTGVLLKTPFSDRSLHNTAVYSRDGEFIFILADDVYVYSVKTEKLTKIYSSYDEVVTDIKISPDGKYFIFTLLPVYHHLEDMQIWDAKTFRPLKRLKECKNNALNIAFSPDSAYIAIAHTISTEIWSVNTCDIVLKLRGYSKAIKQAAFSSDNKYIAVATAEGGARIWDFDKDVVVKTLHSFGNDVESVAYSSNGNFILTVDERIHLWNAKSGEHIKTLKSSENSSGTIEVAIFSPSDKLIIAVGLSRMHYIIDIWDTEKGEHIKTLHRTVSDYNKPESLSCSADENFIIISFSNDHAHMWNINNDQFVRVLGNNNLRSNKISYTPDGKYIIAVSNKFGWDAMDVWDAKTRAHIRTFDTISTNFEMITYIGVTSGPDGNFIFGLVVEVDDRTGNGVESCSVWSVETGELVRTMEPFAGNVIGYSKDGKWLAIRESKYGKFGNNLSAPRRIIGEILQVRDSETGKVVRSFESYPGLHIEGCTFRNTTFTDDALVGIIRQYGGIFV